MMGYFPQRLLYYWAKTYQKQLQAGRNYSLLKKVTLISICKEALPINTQHYYNCFRILDVKNQVPLSDDFNIHTIDIVKIPQHGGKRFQGDRKMELFSKTRGEPGLRVMKKIKEIDDLKRLRQLLQIAKKARDIEEILRD